MQKTMVPFNMLVKTVLVITSPALLILGLYVGLGTLTVPEMIYAYVVIFVASGLLSYPFLSNVSALTHYVNELAQDKRVTAPELSFIGSAVELSESLKKLQASWDVKKKQMETIITEREILVDTLPDILIMVNDEKKVVRTNRAARAIFGQNLAGKFLKDVIPSAYLLDALTSVIQDLKGREIEFRIEDPVIRDFLAIIERFPVPTAGGRAAKRE
ncbi:MAG: hypothetical protein DI582_08525, partial [Azospirillum brasilense]